MLEFFATVIAACIGAMLAPYFGYILNKKKIFREERKKNLEKAYDSFGKLEGYFNIKFRLDIINHKLFLTGHLKVEEFMKTGANVFDEIFSTVKKSLDYQLASPSELIAQINSLREMTQSSFITQEQANELSAKSDLEILNFNKPEYLSALEKCPRIVHQLIEWTKKENLKIDSELNWFESLVIWLKKFFRDDECCC